MPIRDYRIIVDTPAEKARLGFEAIADALAQSIAQSTPRFAVGIFGPWGSGKTTLMQAVRGKLQPFQTIAVDFSAWRYEREEHLLVPLLDTIREAMVEWVDRYAAVAPAVESPSTRQQMQDAVLDTARTVGKVITSLVAGLSVKVGIPGALDLSFEANKALAKGKELSTPGDVRTPLERQVARRSEPDFPQSIYHGCFRELKRAFDSLRTTVAMVRPAHDLRFVIFVDDLDRCLPQGALEVLEAIKLFFETEGFVFVVGLDRSIVERFIEQRYVQPQGWTTTPGAAGGSPIVVPEKRTALLSGADYIKKIFQVPYTLAPVQLSQLDDLLDGIVDDGKLPPDQGYDLRTRVAQHLRVAQGEVAVNPREVKRYINAYVMQMKIRPTLDADVVLTLQTIRARNDWEMVNQALAVHRGELLRVLGEIGATRVGGDPLSTELLAALDPELANLPGSFLEYVTDGPGQPLVTKDATNRIDEYLYSVESAGTSHGAVLLDLLPLLFQARAEVQHATPADAGRRYTDAQTILRRGLSVIGNLEGFPAVRELAGQIHRVSELLVAPSTAELDGGLAALGTSKTALERDVTAIIQRTRALRRSDRLETMAQS